MIYCVGSDSFINPQNLCSPSDSGRFDFTVGISQELENHLYKLRFGVVIGVMRVWATSRGRLRSKGTGEFLIKVHKCHNTV